MPDTLIVQSHRPDVLHGWIGRCVRTVRDWADARGFDYRWLGDELFDHVPDWVRQKVADRLPVASDLARLRLIQQGLDDEGYQRVCWIDADVYLFAPERLILERIDGERIAPLELLLTSSSGPLAGANLCGSLARGQDLDGVCDMLGTVFAE